MLIAFVCSTVLLAWIFVGYPAFGLLRGRYLKRPYAVGQDAPTLSLIVAAYNEADSIGARIENLLSLDYPLGSLQIIVASDGSSDATAEIAGRFEADGVLLLDLPRQGKIPAVNTAMQHATGDIVVMTDANSHFVPGVLRSLVAPFADATVGGVAGNQVYANSQQANGDGEHVYWNLDRRLKQALSASGSVVSATGAVYAIRRSLVQTIPPAVTDDFYTSTGVIDAGYRLVFAPEAVAIEPVAEKTSAEFARKVRVMTRGFRSLWERRRLLNPLCSGLYAVDLLTYKLLKRLIAVPLLIMLVSSGAMAMESRLFAVLFALQSGAYLTAFLGWVLGSTTLGRKRIFQVAAYFGMVNVAALCALMNSVRGRRIDRWEPQRPTEVASAPAADGSPLEVVQ